MNTWIPLIILFFTWSLVLNVILKGPFDKLTMYKDWELNTLPNWFVNTFIVFGMFMFLFYRPIRRYRKDYYIFRHVQIYEQHERIYKNSGLSGFGYNKDTEQYIINKRYLKLRKLQKKSKKIWNYFHV